ncbi:MAG: glycosyltransferase family 4 protein [Nitrospira sp.]|nr:glycosyltransferase family 4 protein [Nitrospira sp.]
MESIRDAGLDDAAFFTGIMKLLFINDLIYDYALNAPGATGGAERYAWLLLRALAADGWNVTVGVRRAVPVGERMTVDGVQFLGLDGGHVLGVWRKVLREERPDWWLWQCADHWWGPAVELAKMAGVRTIFSAMHDMDFRFRQALSLHPRLWPMYAWGLMRADKIFVQHSQQLAELLPGWRAKATVLPGVVTPAEDATAHAGRAPYVAWVAMLREHKRPDLLVEVARRSPQIRFVVCGGVSRHRSQAGYSEQMVSALQALPNVDYRGLVPPEESLDVIAQAAVLLSTSDSEGFPSTFLEAWTSGTPVVSLTVDPDRLLRDEGLGMASGTVAQAAVDLQRLVGQVDLRETIGIRAREFVVKRHSPQAVSEVFRQALPA